MITHPKRALLLGLPFVVVGLIYWVAGSVLAGVPDAAGASLLILLGVAMSTMGFVLVSGSPSGDEHSQDA
jgi:hypothetical protein